MRRNFQEILLPSRLDLDCLFAAFLFRIDPREPTIRKKIRFVGGAASWQQLNNPNLLKLEVGGTGMVETFCFDHHCSVDQSTADQQLGCAAVQVAEYLRQQHTLPQSFEFILSYVDAIDFGRDVHGHRKPLPAVPWPRLLDLVNGMRLVVEAKGSLSPHDKLLAVLEGAYQIFEAVAQAGLNPSTQTVDEMLWLLPEGQKWLDAKLAQARSFEEAEVRTVCTNAGLVLGVLESNNIGMPKDLYKRHGLDAVIARCPKFRVVDGDTEFFVPKYTICIHGDLHARGHSVLRLLRKLQAAEQALRPDDWQGRMEGSGWGHPLNNTSMGCSDRYTGSVLLLEQVEELAIWFL
jgi:hypothetical protein